MSPELIAAVLAEAEAHMEFLRAKAADNESYARLDASRVALNAAADKHFKASVEARRLMDLELEEEARALGAHPGSVG